MPRDERPVRSHVFVDESKQGDYLLVAAVIPPARLPEAQHTIRRLTLPGQPRLHMKKEREQRRRAILSALVNLDPHMTVYRADKHDRTELDRRGLCLDALVVDLARDKHTLLVLERDESVDRFDRQRLVVATREAGCANTLTYRHATASAEPLLAIPDAIAWAYAKGGDWRRRCLSVVRQVVDV